MKQFIKELLFFGLLMVMMATTYAQVGINTASPDPSSILDIDSSERGILIPRMTSAERNSIANPANGLIIYNTDSDEIQINTNSVVAPTWDALATVPPSSSVVEQSVKYSNTDITTNVNVTGGINLPVFGSEQWNDNTTLYSLIDDGSIIIAESGRYEIVINVSLISTNTTARKTPEIRLEVDGTQTGAYGSTGYMRRTNGHEESSVHVREVIEVAAGSVISLNIQQAAAAGTVVMRGVGASNVYINKLL